MLSDPFSGFSPPSKSAIVLRDGHIRMRLALDSILLIHNIERGTKEYICWSTMCDSHMLTLIAVIPLEIDTEHLGGVYMAERYVMVR